MKNRFFDILKASDLKVTSGVEQKKKIEYVILGSIEPKEGHQVYEVDLEHRIIRNAEIEYPSVGGMFSYKEDLKNEKITKKNNCMYYSCLNVANLLRHLKTKYNIDTSTFSIEKSYIATGKYSNRKTSIKSMTKNAAKQCATLNIDELINERLDFREEATKFNNDLIEFLQEVKKEIGLI